MACQHYNCFLTQRHYYTSVEHEAVFSFFTGRVIGGGNAIGRVRPSVCSRCFLKQQTFSFDFLACI